MDKLTQDRLAAPLFGGDEPLTLTISYGSYGAREYKIQFTGLFNMLEEINRRNSDDTPILEDFRTKAICPTCDGARLTKESLHFKIDQKNISELASMDI